VRHGRAGEQRGVDLQEHVIDAQGRALVMGDDDLDLLYVGHHRGDDHRRHRVYHGGAASNAGSRTAAPAAITCRQNTSIGSALPRSASRSTMDIATSPG